jgi:hypothetical protein
MELTKGAPLSASTGYQREGETPWLKQRGGGGYRFMSHTLNLSHQTSKLQSNLLPSGNGKTKKDT